MVEPEDLRWAYTWVAQYDGFEGPFIHEHAGHHEGQLMARSVAHLDAGRVWRLIFLGTPWSALPGHTVEFRAQLVLGESLATNWTTDLIVDTGASIVRRCVKHTLGSGLIIYTYLFPDGAIEHGTKANW